MTDANKVVTVCDACFCASCWRGIWMCEEADIAGTVDKTVTELRAIREAGQGAYEHDDYRTRGEP